jgi:sRNA-binding regulator protein Hfq
MYEAAASCKDVSRASVRNWERLQDTVRRETRNMSYFLRYGVKIRGNVTGCQFIS